MTAASGDRAAGGWRAGLALVLLAAIAWAPALGGAFHYDDMPNIVLDPATAGGAALLERLANGFRPLLRLSYALDHALWGFAPAGFVATNLLLHGMAALLVWRLATLRLRDPLAAFAAGLVFALQPAHGAAVAWASGRSSLLAAVLLLAALLAHELATARERRWAQSVAVGAMLLAVLAKEVALAFPLAVVLWEATRDEPPPPRVLLRRVAPTLGAATVVLAALLAVSPRLRDLLAFSLALAGPLEALRLHAAALPLSLGLWLRPWALAIEHAPPAVDALAAGGGGVILIAAVALALRVRRALPLLAFAVLWPLVLLLPSHSVFARLDAVTEKPLYVAWVGPALALGAVVAAALRRPGLARVAVVAGLAALLSLSAWRAGVWADPVALWREATMRAPQSPRTWINLAVAEMEAGAVAEAAQALAYARRLDPGAAKLAAAEFALNLAPPQHMENPGR